MKSILIFSPDSSLCASLMMYFNDKYNVTATTKFDDIIGIIKSTKFDLIIMDSEPDKKTAGLIDGVAEKYPDLPIILTYVYTSKYAEIENGLKEHVAAVFYKPIDLADVSERIDFFI
ncbi:MAG TPA: hypothetical protein PK397_10390 [Ignavibacteriaceae bacterium]|nr:hypothetical protein [Ignavibacteriaceae bacterium]